MISGLTRRWWWLVAVMAFLFAPSQMARGGEPGEAPADARDVTAAALAPTVAVGTSPGPVISSSETPSLHRLPALPAAAPVGATLLLVVVAGALVAGPWLACAVTQRRHPLRGPPAPRFG